MDCLLVGDFGVRLGVCALTVLVAMVDGLMEGSTSGRMNEVSLDCLKHIPSHYLVCRACPH